MFARKIAIGLALLTLMSTVPPGIGRAATGDGGGGAVPLLVKSRVALNPEVAASIGSHAVRVTYVWPEIDAMAMTVHPSRIAELVADRLVALVEDDGQGEVPGRASDGETGASEPIVPVPLPESSSPIQTWNLDMADTAGSGYNGTGVTVAVVDSGLPQNWEEFLPPGSVDLEHAVGFGAEGWGDFHNPLHAIRGVGGHIGLFPHGLAVSSVITGFPSEIGPIGGAAPGVKILPIRVINQFNVGWFSWFAAGIMHVGRLKVGGSLPGPVVINFSIQARGDSAILASAIDYAIGHGVLFVTVAGNFGPSDSSIAFPGRLPQSITAGAAGWTRAFCAPPVCTSPWFFADVPENVASQVYVAGFSGREAFPLPSPTRIDVLAPGSLVFGEWPFGPGFSVGRGAGIDGVSSFIFGTSFAAPHVAAIVAQMLEKNPNLTQAQAESILRSTALPIPPRPSGVAFPWDSNATGSGLVRGVSAVAATPAP